MATREELIELQWQLDLQDDIYRICSRDDHIDQAELARKHDHAKAKLRQDAGDPEMDGDGRVVIPPEEEDSSPQEDILRATYSNSYTTAAASKALSVTIAGLHRTLQELDVARERVKAQIDELEEIPRIPDGFNKGIPTCPCRYVPTALWTK